MCIIGGACMEYLKLSINLGASLGPAYICLKVIAIIVILFCVLVMVMARTDDKEEQKERRLGVAI